MERTLWTLRDGDGNPVLAFPPHSATQPVSYSSWLSHHSVRGDLRAEVAAHLSQPETLGIATRLLTIAYLSAHQLGQVIEATELSHAYRAHLRATTRHPTTEQIQSIIDSADYDRRLRRHAFRWLTELDAIHRGRVPFATLQNFSFEGKRIALMDRQAGIRKPKELKAALSLRTTYTPRNKQRPHHDGVDELGLLRYYMYRGTDPQHHQNVAMRHAFAESRPLIWFEGCRAVSTDHIFRSGCRKTNLGSGASGPASADLEAGKEKNPLLPGGSSLSQPDARPKGFEPLTF
ncbi:hypothetical protein [Amycolatopsis albispora]|uniref:hypothetical protein n=1 Tax=Amycolatopsis albispora TaxID=1804986 RepID=UPI0013B40FDC|nr:hypothetical protein [Amycolatopsis albispora]